MIEQTVEEYFKLRVKLAGGIERKIVYVGRRGCPDRLYGFPNGRHGFVELKRPGRKADAHQEREHARLAACSYFVDVLDSKEAIDDWIERVAR